MRRRAASTILDTSVGVDFTVLSYQVHDPSIHKALGLNTKEMEWKVQCRTAPPLTIKCHFEKAVTGRVDVRITCNDMLIYPVGAGNRTDAKSRLIEDFVQTWPFRGMAQGLNELHFVEVRLYNQGADVWYPGTIQKQRSDGFFEVMASKPAPGGYFTEELYPFVNKKDLRQMATKQPYTAPERTLCLTVPAQDPIKETSLCADGGENITHYFGRPTPNAKGAAAQPQVLMTVAKDRSLVKANIDHQKLLNFWLGTARAVELIPTRPGKLFGYGSKKWKLMVGLCQHEIEVVRKYKTSKHITLTIDGEILIEALAEDIECYTGGWQVTFRFVGEPVLEFEVFETDMMGNALETKGRVPQKKPYSRVCVLNIENMSDLSAATLFVDGVEFKQLEIHQEAHAQGDISISPTAMVSQYHITVPYKVNKEASAQSYGVGSLFGGLTNFTNTVRPADFSNGVNPRYPQNEQGGLLDLMFCCCAAGNTTGNELSADYNGAAASQGGGYSNSQGGMVDVTPILLDNSTGLQPVMADNSQAAGR